MTTTARTMTRRIATDSAAIAALVINGTTTDLCLTCGGTTYCADDCTCNECLPACQMCETPAAELYTRLTEDGEEVEACDGCIKRRHLGHVAD